VPASENWPEYVLDVAHNPAGAWALRAALAHQYEGRPLTLVFGVLRDKAVAEIAEILFPLAEQVIATRAENPRSADPEEIMAAAARTGAKIVPEPKVAAALERARALTTKNGVVVITGSIYLVGAAMEATRRGWGASF
jgi:dihydrofolate synthase/folylpolyglutamate synthase